MTTSLNNLKSPTNDTPPQQIMYDPNLGISNSNQTVEKPKLEEINELINNIQENKNFVSLPTNHIPRTTDHISNDPHIKPNHIPEPHEPEYINENEFEQNNIVNQYSDKLNKQTKDTDKFILPIIVFLIILALNSPITLKMFYKWFPNMFRRDGHPHWYYSAIKGLIVASIVYYFLYY